jgi:hypothetical protein
MDDRAVPAGGWQIPKDGVEAHAIPARDGQDRGVGASERPGLTSPRSQIPAARYGRVLSHEAEIVRPPGRTYYGATEFAVRDPEDNLWSFGDYAGEPVPS